MRSTIRLEKVSIRCCMKLRMRLPVRKRATARHGRPLRSNSEPPPRAADTCDDPVVMPRDWQATCEACNTTYHKYKRPQSFHGYRCRCAGRMLLSFQVLGNLARQPSIPMAAELSAKWEAKCSGSQTVQLRVRKPQVGIWRCRCPHRCEIAWRGLSAGDKSVPFFYDNLRAILPQTIFYQ